MKTQEEVKHTPTPWQLGGFGKIYSPGKLPTTDGRLETAYEIASVPFRQNYDVLGVHKEESNLNAAFIVRAVNSHEALFDAAKWILAAAPNDCYDIGYQEARQAIAKAIAQAEGK